MSLVTSSDAECRPDTVRLRPSPSRILQALVLSQKEMSLAFMMSHDHDSYEFMMSIDVFEVCSILEVDH